jgi:hypothetical protein
MSEAHTHLRLRPGKRSFKSRGKRGAFFRALDYRTDRIARHNRELWELDEQRMADHLAQASTLAPLPSPPVRQRAER